MQPTKKLRSHNDKEDDNKYLIDEVLENFDGSLGTRIIRNKEDITLHHVLRYLKQLYDHYGIKPSFTHTELLKKFEINYIFFLQINFPTLFNCESM